MVDATRDDYYDSLGLYWVAAVLYLEQARRLIAAQRAVAAPSSHA